MACLVPVRTIMAAVLHSLSASFTKADFETVFFMEKACSQLVGLASSNQGQARISTYGDNCIATAANFQMGSPMEEGVSSEETAQPSSERCFLDYYNRMASHN